MDQVHDRDAERFLIISYSYSGHTHRIAETLQQITGGGWQEIYPWQPYPMAFPELLEQVKKENQGHCRPRLLPVSLRTLNAIGVLNEVLTAAGIAPVPGEALGILDEETDEASKKLRLWLLRAGLAAPLRKSIT